jgi:hypothetical protein
MTKRELPLRPWRTLEPYNNLNRTSIRFHIDRLANYQMDQYYWLLVTHGPSEEHESESMNGSQEVCCMPRFGFRAPENPVGVSDIETRAELFEKPGSYSKSAAKESSQLTHQLL